MTPAEREAHEARCAAVRALGMSPAALRVWAAEKRADVRAIEAVADAYERDPGTLPPLADTLPAPPPEPTP